MRFNSCITSSEPFKKSKQMIKKGIILSLLVIMPEETEIKGGHYGQQVIVPPLQIVSI